MAQRTPATTQAPAHDEEHYPSAAFYSVIAVILIVITGLEVLTYYTEAIRPLLVPIIIVLGVIKFAAVCMFYMHLRFDNRLFSGLFVFGLFIATALLTALMGLFGAYNR